MTAAAARASDRPFTLEHFRAWAAELVLDSGDKWLLEPFQEGFISDVFSGVPECWFIVPEGNGKTTLLAGLALYHCQHTVSAWVPVAASARDQAEILYRQAEGFVFRSDSIRMLFQCQAGFRRIKCQSNGARLQIMAADASHGDGVIPTLAVCDELHRHKNLNLYRTWAGKLDKRDGQIVVISTAGEPGGEFEEQRQAIRASGTVEVDGCFTRVVSPGLVMHEWALPEGGDPDDLELVEATNPFSRVTLEKLQAKRSKPTWNHAHWARFTCNVPTRGDDAAITEVEWAAGLSSERIPAGATVWAGLDVAWKWDTTALVPLWMPERERRLFGVPDVFEPPRDGNSLSPTVIENALAQLADRYSLECVVMDTSRAEQLAEWIRTELNVDVVDRAQSNALACLDYEKFMEAIRMGWLKHPGDPTFTRHALSAVARQLPGGQTRFWKPQVGHSKGGHHDRRVIDALVAAAMVNCAMATQEHREAPRVINLNDL